MGEVVKESAGAKAACAGQPVPEARTKTPCPMVKKR